MVARAAPRRQFVEMNGMTPQAPCTAICMMKAPTASKIGVEAKAHKGSAGSAINAAMVMALTRGRSSPTDGRR